jgi:hypothetical protein
MSTANSNTIVGINSSPPATAHEGCDDSDAHPGEDTDDGARHRLDGERVEVAEVTPGERGGDQYQQHGDDAVKGR